MSKKQLGITLIVFAVIALVGVKFLISPRMVTVDIEVPRIPLIGNDINTSNDPVIPESTTVDGLRLRGQIWKAYPDYAFGLGMIIVAAFYGVVNTAMLMYHLPKEQADEEVN